ncbi:polysaccharide biosynthesis protein [Leptospira gomenensis]|uniref:Polysaccharide biosynthesis protein n=1 Tax=Leptospira gomenensis TaxID=2484974 RepID=A0A5F1YAM6_9LEPT|nr:oligosaccharide flippase family protein [Leptospira gomenensis]TGK33735.1 polysaccharide biosynthesis protein [Leptospira gomenensis]TGK41978.1 polysaccharide biosynthesis protein [Leptospira gomenensis]TGK44200.1 polysaccharide biosynthesis protein [Leptospira gomenensis]TGK57988.1 polysaccharide biosynthesis protein [Leptospira gomenensis]
MFNLSGKLKKVSDLAVQFRKSGMFKSSIFVSVSKAVSSLLNLVFMVYSVNILTKSENGLFQYYAGFLPVLLAIAEFGLPAALVKFLAPVTGDKRKIGVLLSSSLLIKLGALGALTLISLIGAVLLRESSIVVALLVLGSFVLSFNSFFESIFICFGNYISLSFWNPLPNLVRLLVLYGADHISQRALGHLDILAIFTASPLFVLVLFFFVFPRRQLFWSGDKNGVKEMTATLTSFNGYAFLASIFAMISDRMEIFFLKWYHSQESAAVYGTALQLFSGFVILFSVINSLIYPKLSRLVESQEFPKVLWKSVLLSVGMAVVLSPGFFLAEWILNLLFRGKYADSIGVFQILYPNYMLQLVFSPLGIALFALGQPRMLAFLSLLRLVCGLVLANLLIPEYGPTGAASSYFLGQIVSWLILTGYFLAYFRK